MLEKDTIFGMTAWLTILATAGFAGWNPHTTKLLNGQAGAIEQPAKFQMVTEEWNRVTAVPYIVYMPEEDTVLMLLCVDFPHMAAVISSKDRGDTWSPPRYVHTDSKGDPDVGLGTGLTDLGQGTVMFNAPPNHWYSTDHGRTWRVLSTMPPNGQDEQLWGWDPYLVDHDPVSKEISRITRVRYGMDMAGWESGTAEHYSQAYIDFSNDRALTWSKAISVLQWKGVSEVALARAHNGDMVAACRTDKPAKFKIALDHYEGLAVSISKDNGNTWSDLNHVYEWGRHHPCMVVLPNGHLVMTYVVRMGYVDTPDGFPQFGIEAIVSRDHGQTWDLDHRYILAAWKGNRKDDRAWEASSQATSTILLPDGSLLTAFGTGYRSKGSTIGPRDVGVINWRVNEKGLVVDTQISDAPFDSDTRNVFDPSPYSPLPVGPDNSIPCTQ